MSPKEVYVLIIAYLVLNLCAFILYYVDKKRAIKEKRRIPEKRLLLWAVPGAFGAVLGMQIFRHKTRKPAFKVVYVLALLHIVFFVFAMLEL